MLHGYGGSGKSQVALKFAERFRDRYWCVLWIDASSKRAAEKEFKEIARIADVDESVPSVRHWLQNAAKPWLLIVDGADDPDHDVTQYLPMSNHGHTLITSRDPSCAMLLRSAAHEVEVMDHEEGKQLIFKALNITEPSEENIVSAGRIVSELGGLPLALVHAAAAIRQRYFTLDTYLDHYSSHRKELLEKQLMDGVGNRNYTGAVYTTCEISLKKIESKQLQDSTNAIEMMNIFAFFHFDSIPIDVFERAWRNRGAFSSSRKQILSGLGVLNQQTQEWNPFPVLDSLRLLGSQSLLEHGTEEESNSLDRRRVSTHRVVHGWAHDRLPEHERQRFMDLATSLLAESIPMGHDDDSSAYRKALMPHIDYCLRLGTNNDRWFRSDYSERWRLTYGSKFAFVYSEFGRFRETEKIQQRVMRGCQHLLGPNSRETLRATIDLANTFRRQGRLDKARNIQWEVLQSMKSVLGDKDLDTLTAQCGLADTYRDQGLWKEAADLEKGVMEDRVEVLGPNHPDTLKAAADLAKTYRRLGNFELAKLLQKQVLENSSDSNIDTLKVKGQLADTYRDQGRWDEAEQLEKEVIAELEKVVPRDHPHMLIAKGDLAASYLGKDQWEDAERLLEEVVSSMDHVLGNKHPHKLKMAAKLAIAYRGQGRLDDAHSLLLHIISEMEDLDGVLIRDHPDLVRAKGYLADTYRQMDRLDDAQALGEVVLESARRIIGEVHPYTREIALGLAETYLRRGRMDDAKSLRAKF